MNTVEDYLARITSYHRGRPRFEATVALWVSPFVAVAQAVSDLPRAFDIDEAIGVQLDRVGQWVGYSRYVPYALPTAWFSYGDPARGFGKGRWHKLVDPETGITTLDDDIYRDLLKAKAQLNGWDGSIPGAERVYDAFLPKGTTYPFIQDRMDDTAVVALSGEIPSLQKLILLDAGYLPVRPVGATTSVRVTSVNQAPVFGYGANNNFIGGYGRGAWGVSPARLVARGY